MAVANLLIEGVLTKPGPDTRACHLCYDYDGGFALRHCGPAAIRASIIRYVLWRSSCWPLVTPGTAEQSIGFFNHHDPHNCGYPAIRKANFVLRKLEWRFIECNEFGEEICVSNTVAKAIQQQCIT